MLFRCLCKLFLGVFILILTACSGGSVMNKGVLSLDYLAVQIEKGDNWSIMDTNGKVVVKEEYAPEDEISTIFPEGVYWVKTKSDQKYRLFSVNSPKSPLTSEEYEQVTDFSDGCAFVSHITSPIQMINSKGKVVKTLSNEICGVKAFSNGMAVFKGKNGLFGYINADGEIAIKAQYKEAVEFAENLAIVQENNGNNEELSIIDKNGKKKGEIKGAKYRPLAWSFSEGKLPVKDEQTEKLVYINEKGDIVLRPVKDYEYSENGFVAGHAIVRNENREWAVINNKGENTIRLGKYSWIFSLGNGLFGVQKNDKWGVVDTEDNTIMDFKFSEILGAKMGNNFICQESSYFLVNEQGEELKNSEFENINAEKLFGVHFVDIGSMAKSMVDRIGAKGYEPISGKKGVKEIAKVYTLEAQEQSHYEKDLNVESFKADLYDVAVRLHFNEYIVVEKTHKEVVSDGWFASEKTVSDGWDWNDEAKLECVVLTMELNSNVKFDKMADAIAEQLEKKQFVSVGSKTSERVYEIKNGEKFALAGVVEEGGGSTISIYFYPEFPQSYKNINKD